MSSSEKVDMFSLDPELAITTQKYWFLFSDCKGPAERWRRRKQKTERTQTITRLGRL